MLVLTRHQGESIKIGDDILITVVRDGVNVRIGIDAPRDLTIIRSELASEGGKDAQPVQ